MRVSGYPNQYTTRKINGGKHPKIDFSLYEFEPKHHRVSKVIKNYMNAYNVSMEQMAELLGIHPYTLARRIDGGVDYKFNELFRLANLLDMPLSMFLYKIELTA